MHALCLYQLPKNTSLLYHGREHTKYNVTKQVVRGYNAKRMKATNRYTTRHYGGALLDVGVSYGEAMLDVGA